jgi:peptidoglycan/LPS O-acetylase OafA/YrhL
MLLGPVKTISAPQSAAERQRHIPTLDGWRAIAILLVMWHHMGTEFYTPEEYWAHSPTRFGTIGVPIFFGISGLLICKLLLEEFRSTGAISLRAFYIRRCFRILPPLFVFLFAAVILGCVSGLLEVLSSVFFFRNYVTNSAVGVYSAHLWSLSVEEHFYLLWPSVLCLLLATRRSALYTATAALGLGLWRAFDLHVHLTTRFAPVLDAPMRTDFRLDGLLWGCVAAFLLQDDSTRELVRRWLGPVVFAGVVVFFAVCVIRPMQLAAIWSAAAILVMLLATITHPQWWVSRALDLAPFRWIGRISYSLYLWQQIFLVPQWEPHALPAAQDWRWGLLLAFAAAVASYYFVERPFMRMGRRLAARSTAVARGAGLSGALVESRPPVV